MCLSKRVEKLKSDMIQTLPFFPNDRQTREELSNQSINSVMFHYLSWAIRQIPDRPRKVSITSDVKSDHRWSRLSSDIKSFLEKVEAGEDITPYLSLRAHRKGYTPSLRIQNGEVDSWEDKDQILNTKGFHHFHLDMNIQNSGISGRTDDVLFARVSRSEFKAIAIFDHSVFEPVDGASLNAERKRMWDLYDKIVTEGMAPGTVYVSNPITTSGHPLFIHSMTNDYMHIINQVDPQLEDRQFVNRIYEEADIQPPKKIKLKWGIYGLDLGLHDGRDGVFFCLRQGFM